jgi:hypothetical protein
LNLIFILFSFSSQAVFDSNSSSSDPDKIMVNVFNNAALLGDGGGVIVPTGSTLTIAAKHVFENNIAKRGGAVGYFNFLSQEDFGEANCVQVRVISKNFKNRLKNIEIHTNPSSQLSHAGGTPLTTTINGIQTGGLVNTEKSVCMPCGNYELIVQNTHVDEISGTFGDGVTPSLVELRVDRPDLPLIVSSKNSIDNEDDDGMSVDFVLPCLRQGVDIQNGAYVSNVALTHGGALSTSENRKNSLFGVKNTVFKVSLE